MNSITRCGVAVMLAAAVGLTACGDETGKYRTGPDDPALFVTDDELAQVRAVLERQERVDRSVGLRQETPTPRLARSQAGAAGLATPGGVVTVGTFFAGRLPEGWVAEAPSNAMRLAQFAIPAVEGDGEDGLVTISAAGGSLEENMDRWVGQFEAPGGGEAELAVVEMLEADSMAVTYMEIAGTMKASTMPAAGPGEPKPGWRLAGGIVRTSGGLVFVKGTGPDATMAANAAKMKAFLTGLTRPGTPRTDAAARVATHTEIPEPAASGTAAAGGTIELAILRGVLPEGWRSRPASSGMRTAEIVIPRAEGDPADGELLVYYFGPGLGGGVQENIERWQNQMIQPDGRPASEATRQDFLQAGDMTVVMIDVTGTYDPGGTTGVAEAAPPSPQPGWRMLGAVAIVNENQSVFFKGTGPDRTMLENRAKMEAFLKSLARN